MELNAIGGPAAGLPPVELIGREIAGLVGGLMFTSTVPQPNLGQLLLHGFGEADFRTRYEEIAARLAQQADLLVLRAVLAFEVGQIDVARRQLRDAMAFSPESGTGGQLSFRSRTIARECLSMIENVPATGR